MINLLWLCLFSACSGQHVQDSKLPYHQLTATDPWRVSFEKVVVNSDQFSGQGFFRLQAEQLLFFDVITGHASLINFNGEVISVKLGRGEGPGEVSQSFYWHNFNKDGEHLFMGRASNFLNYSADLERIGYFSYTNPRRQERFDTSDALETGMYSMDLVLPRSSTRWLAVDSRNNVFIPVRILDRVNPYFNYLKKEYYETAHTLGVINSSEGNLEKVFGKFPADYKGKTLPHYDDKYISIRNDSVFVGYNASPEIQVYSPYPELEHVYSFGVGQERDESGYSNVNSMEELREVKKNKVHYTDIYCEPGSGLIFRSYVKNADAAAAGLQIYQGKTLMADVGVPFRFNVIGRIGDCYIADGVLDEVNEELAFYKLKIQP